MENRCRLSIRHSTVRQISSTLRPVMSEVTINERQTAKKKYTGNVALTLT